MTWIRIALVVASAAIVTMTSMDAQAAPPLRWPFAPGAEWRFLQGYNGSTHNCDGNSCYQRYGIDLVREDGKTSGQPVYAMTAGEVGWIDPVHKCLSLDIGGGYFHITCHIDGLSKYAHGDQVKLGEQIGTVGPPAGDNGGMSHIHVGVYKARSWQADSSERQPISFSGQFAIEGNNYPAGDSANQYTGAIVKSTLPVQIGPLVPPTSPRPGGSQPASSLVVNTAAGNPSSMPSSGGSAASTLALVPNGAGGTTVTTTGAARQPSDPQTGEATVSVALVKGWNLVSAPVTPSDTSPKSVLSGIAGKYDAVTAYSPRTGWLSYRPELPGASDLESLDASVGFWVRVNQATTLTLTGKPPATTAIALVKGWNLVGYPSNRTRPINEVFGTAPQIERVLTFRASDESWYGYFPTLDAMASDLDIAAPGRGYWVFSSGETTFRIPW